MVLEGNDVRLLQLVNDRIELNRDSAETEASATFTEALAESHGSKLREKWRIFTKNL